MSLLFGASADEPLVTELPADEPLVEGSKQMSHLLVAHSR